jgi:hypothetical protein
MTHHPPSARDTWRVGQRVQRKNTDAFGTVTEIGGGRIQVKWDDGKTSYYRHGQEANVELEKVKV